PILLFDAVRTARRSRLTLLRSLYALALLIVLFAVHVKWFGFGPDLLQGFAGFMQEQHIPPSMQARFAAAFFHTFLAIQAVAVLVLTPTFLAGAIAEECEKGTLPMLLTTHLSNREILLGKLASRVGLLVLLLLTGVPVLALLQLLGGVDPVLI